MDIVEYKPGQKEHVDSAIEIFQKWPIYLDTSKTGSGKTYMTSLLAKELGAELLIVASPKLRSNWENVTNLVGVQMEFVSSGFLSKSGGKKGVKVSYVGDSVDRLEETTEGVVTKIYYKYNKNWEKRLDERSFILVFDEADAISNPESNLSKLFKQLIIGIMKYDGDQCHFVSYLSAMPSSDPTQIFNFVQLFGITYSEFPYGYTQPGFNQRLYHFYGENFIGFADMSRWCYEKSPDLTKEILGRYYRVADEMGDVLPVQSSDFSGGEFYEISIRLFSEIIKPLLIRSLEVELPEQLVINGVFNVDAILASDISEVLQNIKQALGLIANPGMKDAGMGKLSKEFIELERLKLPLFKRLAETILRERPNYKVIIKLTGINNIRALYEELDFDGIIATGQNKKKVEGDPVANIAKFQEDNNDIRFAIISKAVSHGINMDDKFGGHPRFMLIETDQYFKNYVQAAGRVRRISTKSLPIIMPVFTKPTKGYRILELDMLANVAAKTEISKLFTGGEGSAVKLLTDMTYIENNFGYEINTPIISWKTEYQQVGVNAYGKPMMLSDIESGYKTFVIPGGELREVKQARKLHIGDQFFYTKPVDIPPPWKIISVKRVSGEVVEAVAEFTVGKNPKKRGPIARKGDEWVWKYDVGKKSVDYEFIWNVNNLVEPKVGYKFTYSKIAKDFNVPWEIVEIGDREANAKFTKGNSVQKIISRYGQWIWSYDEGKNIRYKFRWADEEDLSEYSVEDLIVMASELEIDTNKKSKKVLIGEIEAKR